MSIFWASFLSWCKERWELLLGFFVGIFAILAIFRKGVDKKTLAQKSKMNDEVLDAEQTAREKLEEQSQENLQTFLDRNDKIEKETKQKLMSLQGKKKERVEELLKSSDPEAAIADALSDLLK